MNEVLPDKAGYVAAAYLVFLALLLIYLAIIAKRMATMERELLELNELADRERDRERATEPAP